MRNLNRVTLIGRLTADPETRQVNTGQHVTSFRLATNYSWKDDAGAWKESVDYHRLVAWNKIAERVATQFTKGELVFVEGKLRSRGWTAQDGSKRSSTEIIVADIAPMLSQPKAHDADAVDGGEQIISLEAVPEKWEKAAVS